MPKTKTSKDSGLKRRFNLTNKKVQFFVVIAIVALLGGGYFTIKSFAATNLYSIDATAMSCLLAVESQQCKLMPAPDKNSKSVFFVDSSTNLGNFGLWTKNKYYFASSGYEYQACILAKGSGTIYLTQAEDQESTSTTEKLTVSSSGYQQYCTKTNPGPGNKTLVLMVRNGAVYISTYSIDALSTPTPTLGK